MTPDPIREAREKTEATRYEMNCDNGRWWVVDEDLVKTERALVDARLRSLEEALREVARTYAEWYDGKKFKGLEGSSVAYMLSSVASKALSPAQSEKGERG